MERLLKLSAHCAAVALSLCAAFPVGSFAARPPNDNFADRIQLFGSSNEFIAVLDGSTLEKYGFQNEIRGPTDANGTVWWSWTAMEATPAVLEIIEVSNDVTLGPAVYIWSPTNLDGFPTNQFPLNPIAGIRYDPGTRGAWTTFMAEPGRAYQVQVGGGVGGRSARGTLRLRLVAGSNPLIIEDPQSQTVRPGGSALFGVIAAGVVPFSYHWYHNGAEVMTSNAPIFTLDDISAAATGAYFAIVSNVYGCSTTSVATLEIVESPIPPSLSLAAAYTNSFKFMLNGNSNAFYRVEYTTNGTWSPAVEFPKDVFGRTSLVRTIGSSVEVSTARDDSTVKLFRAATYAPADEICNNNLRRIHYAKRIWGRQFHMWQSDVPTIFDLRGYFDRPDYGQCTAGGSYIAYSLGAFPTCSVTNHVLEEVWSR